MQSSKDSWHRFILEKWDRFVINEDESLIFQNAWYLQNDNSFDKVSHMLDTKEDYVKFVNEISGLRSNKIIGYLGRGFFGVVYELSNGHAIKFFITAVGGREEELDWYEQIMQRKFSGDASINDIMIYDYGTTTSGISYAEMSKVIPLLKYYEDVDSTHALDYEISRFALIIKRYVLESLRDGNIDDAFNDVLSYCSRNQQKFYKEHEKIFKDILKALKQHILSGNEIRDIKGKNMGVLEQNPDVVVIFDN